MKPLGAFRLIAAPYAVTQWFVLFQMDRNIIFLYLVRHEKDQLMRANLSNSNVIVA